MSVRIARVQVQGRDTAKTVANYLPQNYKVIGHDGDSVLIGGTDNHGWTLDAYVIPRLGSGMMIATEVHLDLESISK